MWIESIDSQGLVLLKFNQTLPVPTVILEMLEQANLTSGQRSLLAIEQILNITLKED